MPISMTDPARPSGPRPQAARERIAVLERQLGVRQAREGL